MRSKKNAPAAVSDPPFRADDDALAPSATLSVADAYFSVDVETDGPIPGPYSMLSFGLVFAGTFDGDTFSAPESYRETFYAELKPISRNYVPEAMEVNGLDREQLARYGQTPEEAMSRAAEWIRSAAGQRRPILVAYPKSFDWLWLYWYFVRFSVSGSPFSHSACYDIKTSFAAKSRLPFAQATRERLLAAVAVKRLHTHHALDDAIEQAEIFAKLFAWERGTRS